MTFKVLKSRIPDDFAQQVEKFRIEKLRHRRTVNTPAPVAHPFVEAAVRRVVVGKGHPDDFVVDFEVIDDSPPPPTLREKKNRLLQQLAVEEQIRLDQIELPPGKRRKADLELNRVLQLPEDQRTGEDNALIDEANLRRQRILDLQLVVADLMARVEDLDESTIDQWHMPDFK